MSHTIGMIRGNREFRNLRNIDPTLPEIRIRHARDGLYWVSVKPSDDAPAAVYKRNEAAVRRLYTSMRVRAQEAAMWAAY